jgi:hypothetical protein
VHKFLPHVEDFFACTSDFPSDRCLIWPGALGTSACPRAFDVDEQVMRLPRRELCERKNGPPKDKQVVLSTCADPRCVNPQHLFWGAPYEAVRKKHWEEICKGLAGDPDSCVLWGGYVNKDGYARYQIVRGGCLEMVHRYVCEQVFGPAPFEKAEVLHSCDVPSCINSRHLRWGSHQENMQEAVNRKRMRQGDAHSSTKIRKSDYPDIFMLREGGMLNREIASKYGVDASVISRIISRQQRDSK